VGRIGELDRIAGLRAVKGRPGVVLNGPAGVGKSRLAREALEAARLDGAHTAWIQATSSAASIALAAFAELLPTDASSDDMLTLMRRSAETLRETAGSRAIVIGVDDAHLLDPTSAALVLHLVATGTVFVLATVRDGAPCPDAIVSLWKDTGVTRIDLGQLDDQETVQLVEQALGGPVEHGASRRVFESSGGNVLYARELLIGAVDSGALAEVDGLWRLLREPRISRSLTELIAERMAELEPGERRVIELLALGEPLRLSELLELTSSEAIEGVEERGLIELDPPGLSGIDVRLAHPLYGDVVRDTLPRARGRDLRLRLAETLRARSELAPADVLRISRWMRDAGEPIPRPMLLEAARAANFSGDSDLGAELAGAAFAQVPDLQAALLLAHAHAAVNRFAEAELVLSGIAGNSGTRDQAFDYLDERVWILSWGLRQWDPLPALLAEAEGWWPDAEWQQRLGPLRTQIAAITLDQLEVAQQSEELLAEPGLDPEVRRQLLPLHAANLYYAGRAMEGLAIARSIRPSVPLVTQSEELALATYITIALEAGSGWVELRAWAEDALRAAVRVDDHATAGLACWALGHLGVFQGNWADTARWLPEAELHLERRDTVGVRLVVRALRVGLAAMQGEEQAAAKAVQRMREAAGRRQPMPTQVFRLALAESRAAMAEGDDERAAEILLESADRLSGMPVLASRLSYEAFRGGASSAKLAPIMQALSARCDHPPLVDASCDHIVAHAARDPQALLRVSEDFEAIGAYVHAMESSAQAAELFAAEGREDSARRAAARAREFHSHSQGTPPLRIDGLDTPAVELTRRESQLVNLAAAGLSNAEIADRLVVSVRTVESHLYRAMQKLGVSDRRELATLYGSK
jgi:DNA-binding CsgD family transcriptional regulator